MKADGDKVDFLLDFIHEQREARKCVERKLHRIANGGGVCYKFLMTGGVAENWSISASSSHSDCTNTSNYFLNAKQLKSSGSAGAWCVGKSKSKDFVQISFAHVHYIRGIATQGRHGVQQRVTKYKVYYSTDCLNFLTDGKEYAGNFDQEAVVVHLFDKPVKAKCIRINPTKFHDYMSMRFDVIGCKV